MKTSVHPWVLEHVHKYLGVPKSEIKPHARFSDLGADDLDRLHLVMDAEEHVGHAIPDESWAKAHTVSHFQKLIRQHGGLRKEATLMKTNTEIFFEALVKAAGMPLSTPTSARASYKAASSSTRNLFSGPGGSTSALKQRMTRGVSTKGAGLSGAYTPEARSNARPVRGFTFGQANTWK
jgi:acyl carrier protein